MGVGDGNGALPIPDRLQKALVHEVRRADLNQLAIDPANTSQIIVEQVLPEDVGGWWIREIGIYDDAGDLCAVANCPPSYKPLMVEGSGRTQVVRVVLIVASTAAIELKIDPSVILATRKYADDQMIEVRAYADTLLAQHLAAADPHPQYKPKELAMLSKSVAGKVDVVLTEAEAKADVLTFTGALTGSINVIVPAAARSWTVRNKTTGAYSLTMKTAAAAGVALVKDRERLLYCDGSAVLSRTADVGAAYGETAAPFDASLRLATMESLQKRGMQFGDLVGVSGSRQITDDDIGKVLWLGGDYSITLPPPGSLGLPPGASVSFYCTSGTGRVLAGAGAQFDTRLSPVKFNVGDYLTFMVASGTQWAPMGTAQLGDSLQFASSMTPYGHKRLPGNFLMQWTTVSLQANVPTKVSWTIAFPTALVGLWTAANNSGVATAPASYLESNNDAMLVSSYSGNARIYAIGH
ncbi:hypothetical protein BA896_001155 [Janthinobacterium lividum]|uniref:Phage tail protein n=1 Tax=Janthinobacterium lividum TaxID=29581 RepID=A0A1E8PNC6_9BURK|nr:hypothetical protein BA896_001155 [Janthinobacterium lividum]